MVLFFHSNAFPIHNAFFLSQDNEVFGSMREYVIKDGEETLVDLAMLHNLGYNEIADANTGIDPWNPGDGEKVLIPTSWILPETAFSQKQLEDGLVLINLPEFRLYLLKRIGGVLSVITFPIGIGREGSETPPGSYEITEKVKDPVWIIPKSFRDEYPDLPDIVPPGPDNPLGKYALRLSRPDYLIHGTNKPLGVGRKVSHGCIRMLPEDIEELYSMLHLGYKVTIVYQTIKIGFIAETPYIEVHKDYLNRVNQMEDALGRIKKYNLLEKIDMDILTNAVGAKRGVPVKLTSSYGEKKD